MAVTDVGTATTQGRLDTGALPFNQPAAIGGLYPSFPWKVFNSKSIVIAFETDLDPVLDLLPPELSPLTTPPQVVCFLNGGYEFGTGGGPYQEMCPLIPVLYEGEPHVYVPVVYLGEGTEEWFAAGREVLGDQKKLAKIELRQDMGRGLMIGTVERPAGHRIVTQIVGPFERQCEEHEFSFPPVIGIRLLPDAVGDRPSVAQLYRKTVTTSVRKAADGTAWMFAGQGTVDFGRSEQDPLYKLAVRNVVNAWYVEFSTIEQYQGEVVKTYV
jgi:acetoacetate decarboxylase